MAHKDPLIRMRSLHFSKGYKFLSQEDNLLLLEGQIEIFQERRNQPSHCWDLFDDIQGKSKQKVYS